MTQFAGKAKRGSGSRVDSLEVVGVFDFNMSSHGAGGDRTLGSQLADLVTAALRKPGEIRAVRVRRNTNTPKSKAELKFLLADIGSDALIAGEVYEKETSPEIEIALRCCGDRRRSRW